MPFNMNIELEEMNTMKNNIQNSLTRLMMAKNAHSPTLETVIMVEETIKRLSACSITELYKALPKTVIYPTLKLIIEYFYAKGFIMSDKEGKIVWVYNPELVRKYKARPDLKAV